MAGLKIQLEALSAEKIGNALKTLPDHYLDPHRVRVGRAVCEEADRRGITAANFSGDWRGMRVKRCEALLNWPETCGVARGELAAIAADPAGGACCNRARVGRFWRRVLRAGRTRGDRVPRCRGFLLESHSWFRVDVAPQAAMDNGLFTQSVGLG